MRIGFTDEYCSFDAVFVDEIIFETLFQVVQPVKFYNWNSSKFENATNNSYSKVSWNDTVSLVLGTEITESFWNSKTCKFEFKYGKNGIDITVDDFEFVYPEE